MNVSTLTSSPLPQARTDDAAPALALPRSVRPRLSIVATLYQSSAYIDEFLQRAVAAARQVAGDDFEIVLVNDGSPDDSLQRSVHACAAYPQLVVVDLSRNFGHHKAMMTAMAHARGERVFLIDTDLEEDPEWLVPFSRQFDTDACDVVYGVQARRKGDVVERVTGHLFYRYFNALTGIDLPRNVVTARLMTHRYVAALLQHQERELDIGGLQVITGFDQRPQVVDKLASSATTYTLGRKIALLINSVTSFSSKPLVYIFYTGLAISFGAALNIAYLGVQKLFLAEPLSGWTSLMASIWMLGGLMILFLGVIGIYLSKMFLEIKQRPYTIIRRIYGARDDGH